jgi:hypothetical protein
MTVPMSHTAWRRTGVKHVMCQYHTRRSHMLGETGVFEGAAPTELVADIREDRYKTR